MKFPKLVIEEAKALKKHATKEEKQHLNFDRFDPESKFRCLYGQMTGDCFSKRATELIEKSCTRVYTKYNADSASNNSVRANTKLNGKPKEGGYARCGVWYSPIEIFISKKFELNPDSISRLLSFIKGKIKEL